MSLFPALIGAGFAAGIAYIGFLVYRAWRRVDQVIDEPPTVFPRRAPGESFVTWADNALAPFEDDDATREDEDAARKYVADRDDIARTASWIEFMTVDQFNAAVLRHLDTFPR